MLWRSLYPARTFWWLIYQQRWERKSRYSHTILHTKMHEYCTELSLKNPSPFAASVGGILLLHDSVAPDPALHLTSHSSYFCVSQPTLLFLVCCDQQFSESCLGNATPSKLATQIFELSVHEFSAGDGGSVLLKIEWRRFCHCQALCQGRPQETHSLKSGGNCEAHTKTCDSNS